MQELGLLALTSSACQVSMAIRKTLEQTGSAPSHKPESEINGKIYKGEVQFFCYIGLKMAK